LILLIIGLIIIAMSLLRPTDTRSRQVSTKAGYGILLILVVFLAVYSFTHYKLPEGSPYTILVDLILITLAFTGAVGYGIFRWIYRGVEDQVAVAMKESQSFSRAQVEINLGFWYFEQYKAENKKKKEDPKTDGKPVNNDVMYYLNHAIERTEKALEFMKELDEKKYEKFLCVYRNNLAFYLAERQRQGKALPGDKELAKSYADYIQKRIRKYPSYRGEFVDTCDFIDKQFPNNNG
ncbi:unnamed protein product, partial [marine sediment metagenome]